MRRTDRAILTILLLLSASPISGQSPPALVEGDSVRFDHVTRIDAFGSSEAARVRIVGSVLELSADTLAIRQSEQDRQFAIDRVSDLHVRRSIPNPRARGFKHGAIGGAAVLGALTFGLVMCNPDLFGDEGCKGPDGASEVIQATLIGAAIGAVPVGILGALFAPHHEWKKVSLSAAPTATSMGPTLSLRANVSP